MEVKNFEVENNKYDIRTMQQDLSKLGKVSFQSREEGSQKEESAQKFTILQKEIEQKLELEKKNKEEERRKEEERLKKLREEEEKRRKEEEGQKEKERMKKEEEERKRSEKEEKRKIRALKIALFKRNLKNKTKELFRFLEYVLISLIVILVLGGIGGFIYWWKYLRVSPTHYECRNYKCVLIEGEGENKCISDENCAPKEPKIPNSLIGVDRIKTIIIKKGNEDLLLDRLKKVIEEISSGKITRILVKLVDGEIKYLNLDELAAYLGINIPSEVKYCFGDQFTFFIYLQKDSFAKRTGLVIEIKDKDLLQTLLKDWEKNLIEDIKPIFLDEKIGQPATEEFQDNVYRDVSIRYINLPNPDLTIDYAIVYDKLIITTSKDSMYYILDTQIKANPAPRLNSTP